MRFFSRVGDLRLKTGYLNKCTTCFALAEVSTEWNPKVDEEENISLSNALT